MMQNPIDKLAGFWRSLDPKLRAAVIGFAVTRAAIALGLDPALVLEALGIDSVDPATVGTIVAGLVAATLGYKTPNVGSELRAQLRTYVAADSGGVTLPPELERGPD